MASSGSSGRRDPEARVPPWVMKMRKFFKEMQDEAVSEGSLRTSMYVHLPTPGMPYPPTEAIGSPGGMVAWGSRLVPENVANKDVAPTDNTLVLQGRPVQLLLVSHAAAPPIEWDSYMNFAFRPLRPTVLFGNPSAVYTPWQPAHYAVIQWWKVFFVCMYNMRVSSLHKAHYLVSDTASAYTFVGSTSLQERFKSVPPSIRSSY